MKKLSSKCVGYDNSQLMLPRYQYHWHLNDVNFTEITIVFTGCVAGDEESYTAFADFMDKIIEFRHNGYTKDKTHKTDLNPGMSQPCNDKCFHFACLFHDFGRISHFIFKVLWYVVQVYFVWMAKYLQYTVPWVVQKICLLAGNCKMKVMFSQWYYCIVPCYR